MALLAQVVTAGDASRACSGALGGCVVMAVMDWLIMPAWPHGLKQVLLQQDTWQVPREHSYSGLVVLVQPVSAGQTELCISTFSAIPLHSMGVRAAAIK